MRAELQLSGMWEPPGRASRAPGCSGVWHGCGEWGVMRFIDPLGWEIVAEDSLGLVDRGRINRYYNSVAANAPGSCFMLWLPEGKAKQPAWHGFEVGLCNLCFHLQARRVEAPGTWPGEGRDSPSFPHCLPTQDILIPSQDIPLSLTSGSRALDTPDDKVPKGRMFLGLPCHSPEFSDHRSATRPG